MICLGCGADCACEEPSSFKEWPLQESLAVATLPYVKEALEAYLKPGLPEHVTRELGNTVNALRALLQKEEEAYETVSDRRGMDDAGVGGDMQDGRLVGWLEE